MFFGTRWYLGCYFSLWQRNPVFCFDMLQSYRNIFFIKVEGWTQETDFLNGRLSCCRVLEDRYYYSHRISVFEDFTAALHRDTVMCIFCSTSNLSRFSRTFPCLLWRGHLCHHPEPCLGDVFSITWKPPREISANPCLKRLLLWEVEQAFQIRLHTSCNMPLNMFPLLSWVTSIGVVTLWHTQDLLHQ